LSARYLIAVLGLLVERWCLRSETGYDPWFGIHGRSYTYVCMYVCIFLSIIYLQHAPLMYVCMYVCMYVGMYVHVYVDI
jgi:hypothetical protein